jgi:hypothetical protein
MLSSRPSSRIQPLYVTFLVHSWSNNCYLGFQIAVLVAIRAAYFQAVADRNCAVTAAVSNRFCESVPLNALLFTNMASTRVSANLSYCWLAQGTNCRLCALVAQEILRRWFHRPLFETADVELLLTRQVSHQRDCLLRRSAFDPRPVHPHVEGSTTKICASSPEKLQP